MRDGGARLSMQRCCTFSQDVTSILKNPAVTTHAVISNFLYKHSPYTLVQNLMSILKKPGVKKKPFLVRNQADVLLCARNMNTDSLAPIFLTSAVTGEAIRVGDDRGVNRAGQRHQPSRSAVRDAVLLACHRASSPPRQALVRMAASLQRQEGQMHWMCNQLRVGGRSDNLAFNAV